MSSFCIQGQCERCGRSRILRAKPRVGGDDYLCAECSGEQADAFEADDDYSRDTERYGHDGWGGAQGRYQIGWWLGLGTRRYRQGDRRCHMTAAVPPIRRQAPLHIDWLSAALWGVGPSVWLVVAFFAMWGFL